MFFFSILPVAENYVGRIKKTQQINTCLRAWCHQENLGYFDHKLAYMTAGLLVTDGVHLSQRPKKSLCRSYQGLLKEL